jgi:hypothetical protein
MHPRTIGRLVVPVILAVAVTGCLKLKTQVAQPTTPPQKVNVLGPFSGAKRVIDQAELKELGLAYHTAAATNNRPPASVDDLGIKQDAPKLYQAIVDGHVVVYWKANPLNAPQGTSNTVLAYDSDVPTKGGAVLMMDGSTRKMTADEFKAAPKAGQ